MKTQLTLCISGTLLLVGMSGCEKTPERPMNAVSYTHLTLPTTSRV